ncbi:MAG: phage tail protein [Rhodocyclaceae bacterium]|nr:phage tail protein [Rhodocyclaceae bacterium]
MADPFLGQISIFAFNAGGGPPRSWAFCDGQTLPIQQNAALFSLLGVNFGGNGTTTFQLPNLQGRLPLHTGVDRSGTAWQLGQSGGAATTTLGAANLPQHSHTLAAVNAAANQNFPSSAAPPNPGTSYNLAQPADGINIYAASGSITQFNSSCVGSAGGGQPFSNLQPYLALNFCIALMGIYPPRN